MVIGIKTMKVQVLSIKTAKTPNSHEVLLSIGIDQHTFIFTTEVNQVGEHQLQTTSGDRTFSEIFRFNQRVAMNVSNLVVKFYNKEIVELPADVGNFVTPEKAISNLKYYQNTRWEQSKDITSDDSASPILDDRLTNQQTKREIIESRHKAILLLEKIPDDRLDEAIFFLESLSVKANNLD